MARRKNTKRIDPRWFMDEKSETIIKEGVESLLGARVVGPQGLEAARGGRLAKPGQSIVVSKADPGYGGQQQGQLQIHILPKGVGFYADLDQAKNAGFTGEAYYATPEAIANQTMDDNRTVGSRTGTSDSGFSHSAE